jgi:hypothetical protein
MSPLPAGRQVCGLKINKTQLHALPKRVALMSPSLRGAGGGGEIFGIVLHIYRAKKLNHLDHIEYVEASRFPDF